MEAIYLTIPGTLICISIVLIMALFGFSLFSKQMRWVITMVTVVVIISWLIDWSGVWKIIITFLGINLILLFWWAERGEYREEELDNDDDFFS